MRDIVGGPYHPPLWRCHSTDAKQAKSDRGAPYIYWGYSRWALASTIVALSQHGSKAGSNDRSVDCSSFVHAWPESSGTAAQHCRRKGCIRHRLTLAHQDRPKPHASRARLPEGVGLLWASPRGKSYDNSHQGHRGWALAFLAAPLLLLLLLPLLLVLLLLMSVRW